MKPNGANLHWWRWLGPALAVMVVSLPALAADRVVIAEEYTDNQ
jgi:hypothetical protein